MIVMFQLKIMLYDDHGIQLVQLSDELHQHIIDIISFHRYHNQYHDIFLDKHRVLVPKHEDISSIDFDIQYSRYEHVPVLVYDFYIF
jgi:hypothetical protein